MQTPQETLHHRARQAEQTRERILKQRLLSAQELARELGVSPRSIWQWRDSGRLPKPVRLGKLVRWIADDIERWLADGAPDLSKRGSTRRAGR